MKLNDVVFYIHAVLWLLSSVLLSDVTLRLMEVSLWWCCCQKNNFLLCSGESAAYSLSDGLAVEQNVPIWLYRKLKKKKKICEPECSAERFQLNNSWCWKRGGNFKDCPPGGTSKVCGVKFWQFFQISVQKIKDRFKK